VSDVARTDTNVTYGDGGYLPDLPHGNAILIEEQDFDVDDNPIGEPRVVYDASTA